MQVHVTVKDSGSAGELIRMLLDEFDAANVCFDAERKVRIEPDGNSDRALVKALGVIEEWVTAREGPPATVEVDGRSYTLGPRVRLGSV